ncbi:MAG: YabP/YqfC family sporulation protein [Clostridia bacterium]|nr:YabP/YqfC family sporulation protein [Clostridia bacterium]
MDKTDTLTQYVAANHEVHIEGQRHARITGVLDVESFHEEEAAVLTEAGVLVLTGEDLKLNRMDPDRGQVMIDGRILSLEYQQPQQRHGLFARLRP